MPRIGFWNLNKRPLAHLVAELAAEQRLDMLVLAECTLNGQELAKALADLGRPELRENTTYVRPRVRFFSRFSDDALAPVQDGAHFAARRLIGRHRDLLIIGVHLPCPLHYDEGDQNSAIYALANEVREIEDRHSHRRTLIVGDFNANPFLHAVVSANGLHAAMTKRIAGRGSRTVSAKEWPFFYNPLWSVLGDDSPGPPGTYYYSGSTPVSYFWNAFDQVLVRPELIKAFRGFTVVEQIGEQRLVKEDGLGLTSVGSDHLPLAFTIDLE